MARIAFLLAPGYEDSEMKNPYESINEAGHETVVVGNEKNQVCEGKKGTISYTTEMASSEAIKESFDGLVIPGGSAPEELRINDETVAFVQKLNNDSKLIASICHGAQVLISADVIKDKTLTCFIGIRDDVKNSGAHYVDEDVVQSKNIITSRTPKDEPAFIQKILEFIR